MNFDNSDTYEETLNENNPNQYLVDGKYYDMEIYHEKINIKGYLFKVKLIITMNLIK